METKICKGKCGEEKPLTEEYFSIRKDTGKFKNICKICMTEINKIHYKQNKEIYTKYNNNRKEIRKEYDRSDERRNSIYKRSGYLFNGQNFTVKDYNNLLGKQNNKCAICERELVIGYSTHVDHDHVTGEVRGLLCKGCNRSIGYLNTVKILQKAINYLQG